MKRDEWFKARCQETLACLPESGRALARLGPVVNFMPDLGPAAVVAHVCVRYTLPEDCDKIARYLVGGGLVRRWLNERYVTADMVRKDLVIPACEAYRSKTLPFWCWWDPMTIDSCLEGRYLQLALNQFGEAKARAELWLWDTHDPRIADRLMANAKLVYEPFSPWELMQSTCDEESFLHINSLANQEACQSWLVQCASLHPAELQEREDLQEIAAFLDTMDILKVALLEARTDSANRVLGCIRQARGAAAERIRGLTLLEQKLLIRESKGESAVRRFAEAGRKITVLDDLGVFPLPERWGQDLMIPTWLHDYVFAKGGRIHHSSAGAVPNLTVVTEKGVELSRSGLGITPTEKNDDRIEFRFVFSNISNETYQARFSFSTHSAGDIYDLALLVLVGWARVNLLQIADGEKLEDLVSLRAPFPEEWLETLRGWVQTLIETRFSGGQAPSHAALVASLAESEEGAGILLSERAKSELLSIEFADWVDGAPAGVATSCWLSYLRDRREVANLRDKYARLHICGNAASARRVHHQIQRKESALQRTRTVLDGYMQHQSQTPEQELAKVAASLGPTERCLVHFAFANGYFDAFWVALLRGKPASGRIDISGLDQTGASRAVEAFWSAPSLESKREALQHALEHLGQGLATPLAKALLPIGIKHIVLSPTLWLDLLPIHCAPVAGGRDLLLDLFESCTYLPSARILALLQRLGSVQPGRCATIYCTAGGSFPNARREVDAIRSFFPAPQPQPVEPTSPKTALAACKDANVVHFACHGIWEPADFYGSALQLRNKGGSIGLLTCARILAEGDFRQAGLVNLAACSTGASTGRLGMARGYAGLDAAFLARGARSTLAAMWEVDDLAALLFNQAFYVALSSSSNVQAAYNAAVRFLRLGEYKAISLPSAIEFGLSMVHPNWRKDVARLDLSFQDSFFWAAFRCSGWPWGALLPPSDKQKKKSAYGRNTTDM